MEKKLYIDKYLAVQDAAMKDEVYLALLEEYRAMDASLVAALEEMAPAHREIVMDYLGALHAANGRMLELSFASAEKS